MRVVDRICLPTLIITAEDDPFVPLMPFQDPRVAGNPHITILASRHGGHCGFVGPASGEDDGYWAEKRILEFVEQHAQRTMIAPEVAVDAIATAP